MIRSATRWDEDEVVLMLERYKRESPLVFHKTSSTEHARKILQHIWAGAGLCYVSYDEAGIHGMIIGIKNPNIWNPDIYAMHEMAFWVNPERRGTRAGYKLLKAYIEECKAMKEQGLIEYYTISKMINSPDLDYGRFGFNKLEEMWSQ
jgi:GNAT superfamily N-acetyltransferase